jgi:hypothetical protein
MRLGTIFHCYAAKAELLWCTVMARLHLASALIVAASFCVSGGVAWAHGDDPIERGTPDPSTATPPAGKAPVAPSAVGASEGKEQTPQPPPEAEKKPKLRWHGSTMLFDQSVGTQTVGLGKDYQSYDPLYEWWIAFKPKYYLLENDVDRLSLNLWANLYYELTNSDSTTYRNEPILGPTWLWATYARALYKQGASKTTVSLSARLTLPTDKVARRSGYLFGAGASAGISHKIGIHDDDAPLWNSATFGVTLRYTHPFNRATTGVNDNANAVFRQDAFNRTLPSDQLSGAMNAANSADIMTSGALQITPKLSYSLGYILLGSWGYRPQDAVISTQTGPLALPTNADAPRFRVNTWAVTSFDYDLLDELSLSLGYYNLTNQIGPDAKRRNVLWSPDARLFFTMTGNLDAIYERFVHTDRSSTTVGKSASSSVQLSAK